MPTQDNIRILLVEKQALLRDALHALMGNWPDVEVVGDAGLAGDALHLVAERNPDVLLLDLGLGEDGRDAIELLSELRKRDHHVRIIVLADNHDVSQRVQAVLLGAVGVMLRSQTGSILKKAVEKVHAGEVWLERSLTANVLREVATQAKAQEQDPDSAKIKSLSGREREIVAQVCSGLSNPHIGERLSISEATVRHHLTSIYNKLSLQNRLELVIFAYRHDLNKLDGRALPQNSLVDNRHL